MGGFKLKKDVSPARISKITDIGLYDIGLRKGFAILKINKRSIEGFSYREVCAFLRISPPLLIEFKDVRTQEEINESLRSEVPEKWITMRIVRRWRSKSIK